MADIALDLTVSYVNMSIILVYLTSPSNNDYIDPGTRSNSIQAEFTALLFQGFKVDNINLPIPFESGSTGSYRSIDFECNVIM